ncbi:MAG: type IV-A pilus assembly ATPase PilB [Gemmatimonadetes bacterium]|nr:type IV-A pilus assembly ATPase PilB [Gemmatimonadota bacterium]
MPDLLQLLIRDQLVTRQQVAEAEQRAKGNGHRAMYALIEMGAVTERALTEYASRIYGVAAVDLASFKIDPQLIKLVPLEIAKKYTVIPLVRRGRTLTVAIADPSNFSALDDLKFLTRYDVEAVVASEFAISAAIEKSYDTKDALNELMAGMEEFEMELVETQEEEVGLTQLQVAVEEAPVVKFINNLLADAVSRGASDVHIEPYEHAMRIRYRIDGVLQEMMSPPVRMKAALTSRVKIMADLNIAERRVPQDGRIKMKMGANRVIDFRVSTLPTLFGEKIVLRILDKGNLTFELEKLGFDPEPLKHLMHAISQPYGIVLVTGPTGSGKTTTLYSALSKVNQIGVNIMTAEDPVEYNLSGINQVAIREEIGLTFAAALRAFLRQDPNIVMVGEIRDTETGSIAIKAALTGHLVLSTIHTNDAPSTINRLIDMGLQPFLVASATNLIQAQRLVRRICQRCKEPHQYQRNLLQEAGLSEREIEESTFFLGRGCEECRNTGYRGRVGLYEVMPLSPTLKKMVTNDASSAEIKEQALAEGLITLRRDGIEKMRRGVTSLEEVLRETSFH